MEASHEESDLITHVARRQSKLHAHDVEKVVNVVLEAITSALAQGSSLELRGFGAFTVREREAMTARHPIAGQPVDVATKRSPFFKAGACVFDSTKERVSQAVVCPKPLRGFKVSHYNEAGYLHCHPYRAQRRLRGS